MAGELSKKLGPLTVGQWGMVGGAGVALYLVYEHEKNAAANAAAANMTIPASSDVLGSPTPGDTSGDSGSTTLGNELNDLGSIETLLTTLEGIQQTVPAAGGGSTGPGAGSTGNGSPRRKPSKRRTGPATWGIAKPTKPSGGRVALGHFRPTTPAQKGFHWVGKGKGVWIQQRNTTKPSKPSKGKKPPTGKRPSGRNARSAAAPGANAHATTQSTLPFIVNDPLMLLDRLSARAGGQPVTGHITHPKVKTITTHAAARNTHVRPPVHARSKREVKR